MAQQERALYTFADSTGGVNPFGGLVFDTVGNLYGVTLAGGKYGEGTVFKLTTGATPVESVLHSFKPDGQDGQEPNGGLIFDRAGNLYGTTYSGGTQLCTVYSRTQGCGTVYRLIPQSDGTWVEETLHDFAADGNDGNLPGDGLVFDAAGNLYGTTIYGGSSAACGTAGCGTVFELTPTEGGTWEEKILLNFELTDGMNPNSVLVLGASGNLYGTTNYAGADCCGTVFELTPSTGGEWNETVLHNFATGRFDGAYPGGVTIDRAGNLYGPAHSGGEQDDGMLFELSPGAAGAWTETKIHSFQSGDGSQPGPGALVFDAAGNLYGATVTGGATYQGAVFELTPSVDGGWKERVLHSFVCGPGGCYPFSSVVLDSAGNIYGLTGDNGGTNNNNSVYEIVRAE
jgi:uncharacterized repeat protein (TIGR03803 family)